MSSFLAFPSLPISSYSPDTYRPEIQKLVASPSSSFLALDGSPTKAETKVLLRRTPSSTMPLLKHRSRRTSSHRPDQMSFSPFSITPLIRSTFTINRNQGAISPSIPSKQNPQISQSFGPPNAPSHGPILPSDGIINHSIEDSMQHVLRSTGRRGTFGRIDHKRESIQLPVMARLTTSSPLRQYEDKDDIGDPDQTLPMNADVSSRPHSLGHGDPLPSSPPQSASKQSRPTSIDSKEDMSLIDVLEQLSGIQPDTPYLDQHQKVEKINQNVS